MLNRAASKIWLCLDPTDMRKSFDTLAARVREHFGADPMAGIMCIRSLPAQPQPGPNGVTGCGSRVTVPMIWRQTSPLPSSYEKTSNTYV